MSAQYIRAATMLPDRTAAVVQRELRRTVSAQTLELPQSRTWRVLELRRKALALELALTAPDMFTAARSP